MFFVHFSKTLMYYNYQMKYTGGSSIGTGCVGYCTSMTIYRSCRGIVVVVYSPHPVLPAVCSTSNIPVVCSAAMRSLQCDGSSTIATGSLKNLGMTTVCVCVFAVEEVLCRVCICVSKGAAGVLMGVCESRFLCQ